MGIKQLYSDNLRKLPNEYGDVSVMIPYVIDGEFVNLAKSIGIPDDCTIGYIINYLLDTNLTVAEQFHSHLEYLGWIRPHDIKKQITLSYYRDNKRTNIVQIEGFSQEEDSTRFLTIHCFLHPHLPRCINAFKAKQDL